MSIERFLDELLAARSTEEKAALVAKNVIDELPPYIAKTAIRCSFLYRFTPAVVELLLKHETTDFNSNITETILALPFVEKVSWGFTFHNTTRQGLIDKYKIQAPDEIVLAFKLAEPALLDNSKTDEAALAYLYGLIVTNDNEKIDEYFSQFLREILSRSQLTQLLDVLEEAEKLFVVNQTDRPILTSKYWLYKAQLYVLLRDYKNALVQCNVSLQIDQSNQNALCLRAILYASIDKNDERGLDEINNVIELYQSSLSYRTRGGIYLIKKDFKTAIFDFTRAIRLDPEGSLGYVNRAEAFLHYDKPSQALADFDRAIKVETDEYSKTALYAFRIDCLLKMSEWDKALININELINLMPSSGAYYRRAFVLEKTGQFNRAMADYDKAIELDSNNPFPYIGRGIANYKNKDYSSAITDLELGIKIASSRKDDISDAFVYLGKAYSFIGDTEKTNEIFVKAINYKNDEMYLIELVMAARELLQFQLAVDACQKIIKVNPQSNRFSLIMGFLLMQFSVFDEAEIFIKKELKKEPKSIYGLINLGIIQLCTGNSFEAHSHLKKALRETQGKGDIRIIRMWLQIILGDHEQAVYRFKDFINKTTRKEHLYDLRDWNNVLLKSGLDETGEIYNLQIIIIDTIASFS